MTDQNGQMLHELLARERIKELRALYGWHAARGDYESIVQLFAPDGVFECLVFERERIVYRGHGEIRGFLKQTVFPGVVFPLIHNDIIRVKGDEAVGSCAMESRTSQPNLPQFAGYYHDKARVVDGRWLFTERKFYRYLPQFERSGLDFEGKPEQGLAMQHDRKPESK
jgi:SnoaL-like domain